MKKLATLLNVTYLPGELASFPALLMMLANFLASRTCAQNGWPKKDTWCDERPLSWNWTWRPVGQEDGRKSVDSLNKISTESSVVEDLKSGGKSYVVVDEHFDILKSSSNTGMWSKHTPLLSVCSSVAVMMDKWPALTVCIDIRLLCRCWCGYFAFNG